MTNASQSDRMRQNSSTISGLVRDSFVARRILPPISKRRKKREKREKREN